ncbi:MAG: serine--tRNA ligase [Rhizobacter sp.]|nr:serine--tRNA ligase [Chlorobiales bacterium]
MLDIKYIRENPDHVKAALVNRQMSGETAKIDTLLQLDTERRRIISEVETLKATRNKVSDDIAAIKKQKGNADAMIAEMKTVSDTIASLDRGLAATQSQQEEILLQLPNVPHSSVPIGKDASENTVHKEVLTSKREFDFAPKDHLELGKSLGLLDFERGAKISGAGFPLYMGKGATLERALINFMLDLHLEKHGYTEIFPPFFVNQASLRGTGQFPKFIDQVYHIPAYDLYAIPTAEVPVTNIHAGEVLKGKDLPIKYAAYSACFRSEAGSYGAGTKGFLRVHQFNKVEMVKFALPETSYDELETLVSDATDILDALQLPYRILLLCTGDMSANAAKCYDIEVWSPAEQKFLEASSCSNFEDFQARRAGIRFKRDEKSKTEFIHTLNGSGLATSRLMVALLETYQTKDGHITVPEVLRPYTKFAVI